MSKEEAPSQQPVAAKGRPVGGTEHSWCKAVPGGTGITTLALLLSKPPDITLLQDALHKLQIANPILNSEVHFNPTSCTYSYVMPSTPRLEIQLFDLPSTAQILQDLGDSNNSSVSHFHLILEHEMNRNVWQNHDRPLEVFFASVYTLDGGKWVLSLRLHTSACDRTAAAALLRKLLLLVGEGAETERLDEQADVSLGIEDYIPKGKANKAFWARGVDMLGYSLNSFRLANLDFINTDSERRSQFVRLQLNLDDTNRILSCCKSLGIKSCALLAAAGLIATRSAKCLPNDQWEKYAVITLVDCRAILDPVLSSDHLGFYHSAILNTHDLKGGAELLELAKRVYTSFANAKSNNKHFSDMADLNFLMCKAIENPGLTPSASMRTSLLSVFEDPKIDNRNILHEKIGLEDFIGCASAHGVGPSIAIFETIVDGKLDCACVYPSPLHSRDQMQALVEEMKRILVDGSTGVGINN